MKYRKKPVVIEAIQLQENPFGVVMWAERFNDEIRWKIIGGKDGPKIEIPTLEGVMTANKGDYIIRGVQGEYYPCKPDIFEQTYEPVEV